MFRFFRHHSWILIVTLSLTIISFVIFMGKGPSRSGMGGGSGDYGTIYGQVISPMLYDQVRREFFISYWEQTEEWPDKGRGMTADQIEQQVYSYLILQLKAKQMGIQVGDDAAAAAASEVLRSPALMRLFGSTEPIPPSTFVEQVLTPEGLTAADFERSVRAHVAMNQLVSVIGLPGAMITPQEAGAMYDQENRDVQAQAIFFSASNYLAQTSTSPGAVGQFYTNNLAAYREPDRVQVNYVVFNESNYLEQSKAEWAKTNFQETVEALYVKYGATQFADAKTPEDAKKQIQDILIKRRALDDAAKQANDFVAALYAMNPAKPDNLDALAKQKGVTVYTSDPFGASTGPEDMDVPASFTKAAFQLNSDSPYTGPIASDTALYVIALAHQYPSMIPTLDQIRDRVTADLQIEQAVALARAAGTNFFVTARSQMAAGKSFAQVAAANNERAESLTPFSLNTAAVPELADHADLTDLKRAAFTTRPGTVSQFFTTSEGGFLLYVQSIFPVDESKKAADFPKFLSQVRRGRMNEAFNTWMSVEINRELHNTPFFQQLQARGGQ